MDYLVCGHIAYAVTGGIQIDSCEVFSNAEYGFCDVPPSAQAVLRDDKDSYPVVQTTLFGKKVTEAGLAVPDDDLNRVTDEYRIFKGYSIEAQEVPMSTASVLLAVAVQSMAAMERIKQYRQYLSNTDITRTKYGKLQTALNVEWQQFISRVVSTASLTTGGASSLTLGVSGFPVNGSVNYTYQPRWGFGTLKVRLVSNG